MTELVWMKVYIGTETSRTVDLTAEEFGAYERLRRYYWEHEGLPNDDRRLMRITGVDPERWEEVRSGICWLFEEGWRLPALDVERGDAAEKRERKVAAGRKGAEKRWDGKRNGPANGSANGIGMAIPMAKPDDMPMADAMDNQWPSASASEHSLYDERLAPTRAHARDPDAPIFMEVPETEAEGGEILIREGLWPKQVKELLPILMKGRLDRSQVAEALERKRA